MTRMNKKLDFLKSGEVGMLFGKPAMGKTAMAYNILLSTAEQGVSCYYYGLESGSEDISLGLTRTYGDIDRRKLFGNGASYEDIKKLRTATKDIAKLPIYILGNSKFDLKHMIGYLKDRKVPSGSLVVIDYLQLATSLRDADFIPAFKDFAVSSGVKVLVLSQLRWTDRDEEEVSLETSMASSTKEAVEASDRVCFVHRDSFLQEREQNREPIDLCFLWPNRQTESFEFVPSSGRIY